jgi:hypothetical protein
METVQMVDQQETGIDPDLMMTEDTEETSLPTPVTTPSQPERTFDPLKHLVNQGSLKNYLPVAWRIVWLRTKHPNADIVTEAVNVTEDYALFRAVITIPGGGSASSYGSETKGDFKDFAEKAESKAIGRALIALGFGGQYAQHEFSAAGEEGGSVAPQVNRQGGGPARTFTPRAAVRR